MIIRPLPSVAYSANVGGTGTLIGTPPNLILMELLETRYPGGHPLTFGGWMVFSLPDVLINLALVWIILQLYFHTPSWREVCRYRSPLNIMVEKAVLSFRNKTFWLREGVLHRSVAYFA